MPKNPPAQTCPNGHAANSDGNCSHTGCPYHFSKRHDGIGR